MWFLPALFLPLLCICRQLPQQNELTLNATVYRNGSNFEVKFGVLDKEQGIAVGQYRNEVFTTGWGHLTISTETKAKATIVEQGFAAGLLEGSLTQPQIYDAWFNINGPNGTIKPAIITYILNQTNWLHSQIRQNPNDPYWQTVDSFLSQVDGIYTGYLRTAPPQQKLTWLQIYSLTMAGDMEDIYVPNEDYSQKDFSCSALVRLAEDDLYVGHSTFNQYYLMLRIFKHYTIGGSIVSFSSRPGDLESKDDFYTVISTDPMVQKELAVVETSLGNFNMSLYKNFGPQTVPAWLRAQTSNRLANSAPEWIKLFRLHNSGTHNNEWIVVDYVIYKMSKAGGKILENIAWLLDQVVFEVEAADVTFTLLATQGWIGSFNLPYFPRIFNVSGFVGRFNYDTYPRNQIFHRDAPNVETIEDMKHLMNANDYKNDPLSQGDPCNQISARCDLAPNGPSYGGVDTKVTGSEIIGKTAHAISGPSYQTQPVFSFEPKFDSVRHQGMPLTWNFSWVLLSPTI